MHNFGSAAGAVTLPHVAGVVGGPAGWRWAIAPTGVISAAYRLHYRRTVTDTPSGRVFSAAYFCTFGSELAVVTMLPAFFTDTFGIGTTAAGMVASGFAFMNLIARPTGGLLSDLLGSRKRTLSILLVGLAGGHGLMATIDNGWPLPVAIATCMVSSFFVQSGEGAVFAIVPMVKKRVSGQISGIVGAYGNLGAVVFLTALLFVGSTAFFLIIAAASIAGLIATRWLVEPVDSFSPGLVENDTTTASEPALLQPQVIPPRLPA
ncbi:MFS transporter [Rhabdothermincola sediminis]|uniref:MFS transporter n=1 Tax=Rhabdothermincola sediminis TaxID=2751370 RepID=UPI001AA0436B|nr:MFS transporter [Rhabdothermincola sediminis]